MLHRSGNNHISKQLEILSDESISNLLAQGMFIHSGYGSSVKLEVDGIPLFVKKVPLNQLEGKQVNINSTENLFGIPTFYQYGLGSAGFNIWREVSAHIISTKWVLANECQNFPIMYHWRILNYSEVKIPMNEKEWNDYVRFWESSFSIGERVRANHNTQAYIALFMEYFPDTLQGWLSKQLLKGNEAIDRAIEMVERNLVETTAFIMSKEMIHFDAHFRNIITDGERLYFSDFGLATSSQFALSLEEQQFFKNHQNYDRCFVVTILTNWIISEFFGKDLHEEILQEYTNETCSLVLPESLTPYLSSIVKRYASIALKMNKFFKTLKEESKKTPYPKEELDQLWIELLKRQAFLSHKL
ncbi:MAG: protein kinase family protein [Parachlamydiaceae bacterium]|nr:protein kinase family protein [Parachlamydiaceae bacterium]